MEPFAYRLFSLEKPLNKSLLKLIGSITCEFGTF